MSKHGILFILLAAFSVSSYAGYYIKVDSRTSNAATYYQGVGYISACKAHSWQALREIAKPAYYSYSPVILKQIDEYFELQMGSNVGYVATVLKLPCLAVAGDLPDPSTVSPGEIDMIEAINPNLAVNDALALWALGMTFLATIWAGRRIYKLFDTDIK